MPYQFTPEEFNRFSEEVLNAGGDQATLTTLLADMGSTVTEAIASGISATERVNTVTAENERLRNANMELFLRVGNQNTAVIEPEQEPATLMDTRQYMKQYFSSLERE